MAKCYVIVLKRVIFYIKVATCPKETCRLYKILPNSRRGQHRAFQEWICLQNQAPSHEEQHQLGGLRLLTGKKSSSRKDTCALQFPRPWFVTARLYQDVPIFSRQALPFFIWTQLWHLRAAGKPERGKKKKRKRYQLQLLLKCWHKWWFYLNI